MSFLNQLKEENDSRKYFMINLHERMLPTSAGGGGGGGGPTRDLLVSSRTRNESEKNRRNKKITFPLYPYLQG